MLRVMGFWAGLLAAVLLGGSLLLWLADRHWPVPLEAVADRSPLLMDRHGTWLWVGLNQADHWQIPADLEALDPKLLDMVVAFEDQRFWWHPGVDPLALARAMGQWIRYQRVVSGASTLTMQTARLLEPRPRTVGYKLREMLRALQLEWHLSKAEILTLYFSLAPYGGNLQGVEAASYAWLGKSPARLTLAEAALLTVLPQSPSRFRPDRHPEAALAARNKVLQRMAVLQRFSPELLADALHEPLPRQRQIFPRHAYHLAQRLPRAELTAGLMTTLDAELQQSLEALLATAALALPPRHTLAALVVDHASGQIRGYVGSHDPFAPGIAGHNDMVVAIRSPGSTLKPLVYALAFDERRIHPLTRFIDQPQRFGDYAPRNFDGGYQGDISLGEALQQSLNIPAVAVLERFGAVRFGQRLAAVGVPLRIPGDQTPGLATVLGGAGMSLEGLVTLYQALAREGQVSPVVVRLAEPVPVSQRLFGAEAARITAALLQQAPPPHGVSRLAAPRIAAKTGTAYGYRDTWAVGVSADYTVGVWSGRPDGGAGDEIAASARTAPLLWRVFDLLPQPTRAVPVGLPPGHWLAARFAELPTHLQYFSGRAPDRAELFTLSIPGHGRVLELPDCADTAVTLSVSGGSRPLTWFIDHRPQQGAWHERRYQWQPEGAGQHAIAVVDSEGRMRRAQVWVEWVSCF